MTTQTDDEIIKSAVKKWLVELKGRKVADEQLDNTIKYINKNVSYLSYIINEARQDEREKKVDVYCFKEAFEKGRLQGAKDELEKIKGKQTDEIERILGYKNYDNVIRRENMTFIQSK